jgi:hypothetical protein
MRNPGLPEEPSEVLVDVSFGDCSSMRAREKIGSRIREQVEPLPIGTASIEKIGGYGDEPVLVAFPVQNRKDAGVKIHVPDFEVESLRKAQPAAVEDTEEQRHDPLSVRHLGTVTTGIDLPEERREFCIAEDIRDIGRYSWKAAFGEHVCRNTDAAHVQSQLPNDANPVLQGCRRFIGPFLGPCMGKFL